MVLTGASDQSGTVRTGTLTNCIVFGVFASKNARLLKYHSSGFSITTYLDAAAICKLWEKHWIQSRMSRLTLIELVYTATENDLYL